MFTLEMDREGVLVQEQMEETAKAVAAASFQAAATLTRATAAHR